MSESDVEYFEKEILTERGIKVFTFRRLSEKNEYYYRVYTPSIIFIMRKDSAGNWNFPDDAFSFIPQWLHTIQHQLNTIIQYKK